VDGAVIGGASLAIALPYAFTAKLITPRCPCDPAEVNAFDRGAIGNHSDLADYLSTATVAAVIAGSIIYELLELGVSEPFAEDMIVLAEALAVNGALVTFAKYTVQRPIPRVYAEPPGTAADYRSFLFGSHLDGVRCLVGRGADDLRMARGCTLAVVGGGGHRRQRGSGARARGLSFSDRRPRRR